MFTVSPIWNPLESGLPEVLDLLWNFTHWTFFKTRLTLRARSNLQAPSSTFTHRSWSHHSYLGSRVCCHTGIPWGYKSRHHTCAHPACSLGPRGRLEGTVGRDEQRARHRYATSHVKRGHNRGHNSGRYKHRRDGELQRDIGSMQCCGFILGVKARIDNTEQANWEKHRGANVIWRMTSYKLLFYWGKTILRLKS